MTSRGRPHRLLIDLVAGRHLREPADPVAVAESAVEHRVDGLLHSRLRDEAVSLDATSRALLARHELVRRHHVQRLRGALSAVLEVIGRTGSSPPLLIKGLATASQFYERPEERTIGDLDVVLPADADVATIVRALQPDHPLQPLLDSAGRGRWVQSIEVDTMGTTIDLHLDPLKLGVPTRCPELIREGVIPGGELLLDDASAEVMIPGPELAFVLAAIHLNRDAFSLLDGYTDVVQILRSAPIEWTFVREVAAAEGVDVILTQTLDAVSADLELELPVAELSRGSAIRRRFWRALWGPKARLSGGDGLARKARRELWLPLMLRRGLLPGLRSVWRYYFPPRELVEYYFPEVRGGYLRKNILGRLSHERARREARRQDG